MTPTIALSRFVRNDQSGAAPADLGSRRCAPLADRGGDPVLPHRPLAPTRHDLRLVGRAQALGRRVAEQ
jgi:hypothetical protein